MSNNVGDDLADIHRQAEEILGEIDASEEAVEKMDVSQESSATKKTEETVEEKTEGEKPTSTVQQTESSAVSAPETEETTKTRRSEKSTSEQNDAPEAQNGTATGGSVVQEGEAIDLEVTVPAELLLDDECKLCDVKFTNPDMARQHYSGKKHAQKENQYVRKIYEDKGINPTRFLHKPGSLRTQELRAQRNELSKTPGAVPDEQIRKISDIDVEKFKFSCFLCGLHFQEYEHVELHVKTPMHAQRIWEYQQSGYEDPSSYSGGYYERSRWSADQWPEDFRCRICDKAMNSVEQYELHVQSKKHLQRLEKTVDTGTPWEPPAKRPRWGSGGGGWGGGGGGGGWGGGGGGWGGPPPPRARGWGRPRGGYGNWGPPDYGGHGGGYYGGGDYYYGGGGPGMYEDFGTYGGGWGGGGGRRMRRGGGPGGGGGSWKRGSAYVGPPSAASSEERFDLDVTTEKSSSTEYPTSTPSYMTDDPPQAEEGKGGWWAAPKDPPAKEQEQPETNAAQE